MGLLVASAFALAGAGAPPDARAASPAEVEWVALENGLRVAARQVGGTDAVAVVAVYQVGEGHDPEGRSGLAHLIEHLLVTAPAEGAPRRSLEEVAARYARGFHAKTGETATAIGGVVPAAALEAELREVAARMGALRPAEEDLARERAHLVDEIGAMWERTPPLVAANRARELVLALAPGRRRGGTAEGLSAIDLALVRDRVARWYKPANALVSIAGGADPQRALALARAVFARLPRGERAPPPLLAEVRERAAASAPVEHTIARDLGRPRAAGASLGGPLTVAALPAPAPSDPDFPPFLVLAARLGLRGARAGVRVAFEPLEDGRVFTLSTDRGAGALRAFLAGAAGDVARAVPTNAEAEMALAPVLGDPRRQREIEAALRPAMQLHLGIDPEELRAAVERASSAALARAARRWLDPERAGIVTVREGE